MRCSGAGDTCAWAAVSVAEVSEAGSGTASSGAAGAVSSSAVPLVKEEGTKLGLDAAKGREEATREASEMPGGSLLDCWEMDLTVSAGWRMGLPFQGLFRSGGVEVRGLHLGELLGDLAHLGRHGAGDDNAGRVAEVVRVAARLPQWGGFRLIGGLAVGDVAGEFLGRGLDREVLGGLGLRLLRLGVLFKGFSQTGPVEVGRLPVGEFRLRLDGRCLGRGGFRLGGEAGALKRAKQSAYLAILAHVLVGAGLGAPCPRLSEESLLPRLGKLSADALALSEVCLSARLASCDAEWLRRGFLSRAEGVEEVDLATREAQVFWATGSLAGAEDFLPYLVSPGVVPQLDLVSLASALSPQPSLDWGRESQLAPWFEEASTLFHPEASVELLIAWPALSEASAPISFVR